MTKLSPAAQAVLDAFLGDAEDTGLQLDDMRENIAAALRAAADQLTFKALAGDVINPGELLDLAAELEAQ